MKKLLVIDTTWPINSRTSRFVTTLSKTHSVVVTAWNRGDKIADSNIPDGYSILQTNIGYGNKLKKLFSLLFFIKHICKHIKKEQPDLVFASHWDSLLCAVLIKKLTREKFKIIYDCLDLPTATNKLILALVRRIENICTKSVDLTVIASRYYKPFYEKVNSIVFENYPSKEFFQQEDNSQLKVGYATPISTKTISWIGVVRYYNILENLLLAIKDTEVHLLVFGDGPDLPRLKSLVKSLGLEHRVIFNGRYKLEELPAIYSASNLIWAAYPTKDFNAVYAISNKYFECSLFKKRPIFSKNTMMVRQSLKGNTDIIAVDEYDIDDIREKVLSALERNIEIERYEPIVYWEDKEDFFSNKINDL
ncbi:hypothetical protein RP300_01223 [Oligella urethralis]|uniref:glycosyltransferase n=1 Tax=Oligella urethralis TaxID=90245 RepID=UPI002958651E|nr:glycosyltransferase [Oligella urethralis]WOS37670.1 hypothetical protein RP300_01223 [Oligella urethralis]